MISMMKFFLTFGLLLMMFASLFSLLPQLIDESVYCSEGWKNFYGNIFGNNGVTLLCNIFPSISSLLFYFLVFAIGMALFSLYVKLSREGRIF